MDALKTSYVDAVFSGNRKYTEINNSDGTVSFTDSTSYTQEGTQFGANDINGTNSAVNAMMGTKSATIPISGWSGSAAPYSRNISVSGIVATDSPIIAPNIPYNASAATTRAIQKAWTCITKITTRAGGITVYAHTPIAVEIPIIIKGV